MGAAAEWLDQARRDLEVARNLFAATYFEWACYAAQQCAEKSVKAVRVGLGTRAATFKKLDGGHKIETLFEDTRQLLPVDLSTVDPLLARVVELDVHNEAARYPGDRSKGLAPHKSYDRTTAEEAIKIAAAVFALCEPLSAKVEAFWKTV